MANPLYGQFGGNQQNFISKMMSEVSRLQRQIQNPKQMVEQLMQSGKMSQQDFNRLSQMANQIMGNNR